MTFTREAQIQFKIGDNTASLLESNLETPQLPPQDYENNPSSRPDTETGAGVLNLNLDKINMTLFTTVKE